MQISERKALAPFTIYSVVPSKLRFKFCESVGGVSSLHLNDFKIPVCFLNAINTTILYCSVLLFKGRVQLCKAE